MRGKMAKFGQRFVTLYSQGMTYDEISRQLGISTITAVNWRKRLDLPARRQSSEPLSWMDEPRFKGRSARAILKSISEPLSLTDHDIESILARVDKSRQNGPRGQVERLILAGAFMYLRSEGSGKRPIAATKFVQICRERKTPITRSQLFSASRLLKEEGAFPSYHLKAQQFLERWWPRLRSQYGFPDQVRAEAMQLVQILELTVGRTPEIAAAGCLVQACRILGVNHRVRDIADAFGVTEVSVRNMTKVCAKVACRSDLPPQEIPTLHLKGQDQLHKGYTEEGLGFVKLDKQELFEFLRENPNSRTSDIADHFKVDTGFVRKVLGRRLRDGQVKSTPTEDEEDPRWRVIEGAT